MLKDTIENTGSRPYILKTLPCDNKKLITRVERKPGHEPRQEKCRGSITSETITTFPTEVHPQVISWLQGLIVSSIIQINACICKLICGPHPKFSRDLLWAHTVAFVWVIALLYELLQGSLQNCLCSELNSGCILCPHQESSECPCGAELQTRDHILFECEIHEEHRHLIDEGAPDHKLATSAATKRSEAKRSDALAFARFGRMVQNGCHLVSLHPI